MHSYVLCEMLAFPLRASDLKVHYVQHDKALLAIKTELDCLSAVRTVVLQAERTAR